MAGKIKLALCVGKAEDRNVLATQLGARFPEIEVHLICATFEELLATNQTLSYETDVIFLDTASVRVPWNKPLTESLAHFKRAKIVATLSVKNLQVQDRLEERGVAVVLPAPYNIPGAGKAVQQASAMRVERAEAAAVVEREAQRKARILAVYAPKGGAGATHLAANLAIALLKQGAGSVALVDLALEFADQHSTLPQTDASHPNVRNLADTLDHVDSSMLLDQIMRTDSSGLKVLYGPRSLAEGQDIDAPMVLRILDYISAHFDWIVVDLATDLTNQNMVSLGVLEAAARVVLVTTPEVQQLQVGRRFVDFLRRASFDESRLFAVLNRADVSAHALTFEEADRILSIPVQAQVRSDERTVRTAENDGKPFISAGGDKPISQDVLRLALIIQAEAAMPAAEKAA